ncbi:MAG: transporter substrate-binding domain-containing protein [Alphaproteobacteria bacterium]|nr:transporter substrate-binding domain-containing protein [Alphaproteobacteria bacterium]
MGSIRSFLLAVAAAALSLGVLPQSARADEAPALRVGLYQNAPKLFLDEAGEAAGFFPELLGDLARRHDLRLRYVTCKWADCLSMLERGQLDLMPDVAWSEERATRFRFGHEAVLHSWSLIYGRPGLGLDSLRDLDGRRIAVLRDSIQHRRLQQLPEREGLRPDLVLTASHEDSLRAVEDGRADAAVVNNFFGYENEARFEIERSPIRFNPGALFLAYGAAAPDALIRRLDLSLATLKQDPESPFYHAKARWLDPAPAWRLPPWAIWAAASLAIGLLLSIVGVASLRRRVAAGVAHLAESEQRFRDFAETASDWLWEMDAQLRFNYFSNRFEQVTGVPPDDLLGKTRAEVGAPGADPEALRRHLEDLRAHRPFRDFRHLRVRPDEATVHLAISGAPRFDAAGRFLGYRGVGRNVTGDVLADLARDRAAREAEAANEAKSNFIAMMSHEFRTPLNSILGFSDAMGQQVFGPIGNDRYADYIGLIHQSGERLLSLVNDVLDLSKIEAGKMTLSEEAIDVASALDAMIDRGPAGGVDAQGAPCRNARVALEVHAPARLWADPRAVAQILDNLVGNALKYAGPEAAITVRWTTTPDGAGLLEVQDDGCGVAPDHLHSLTQPFVQGRNPEEAGAYIASADGGVGLGLAIVHRLAALHQATVVIDSALQRGTTVSVRFPAARLLDPDGDAQTAGVSGRAGD